MSAIFLFLYTFYTGAIFVRSLPCVLAHLRNVLYLFIAIEYDKTPTRFLSAWGPETKEQIKLVKY